MDGGKRLEGDAEGMSQMPGRGFNIRSWRELTSCEWIAPCRRAKGSTLIGQLKGFSLLQVDAQGSILSLDVIEAPSLTAKGG